MKAMQQTEGADDCNHCAALLVHSWRLMMVRGAECPVVTQQFKCACGASGPQVFAAFCTFLCALAFAQRRCLRVNPPGECALTMDEQRMLALVACAQNGCNAALDAHLCWLARRMLRKTLEKSVRELADALGAHQLRLPVPV